MIIKYTGTSDFQEFGKADFDKAGVEGGKKLRFARNEPVEVDDTLAEALISKEGLFGDFSFEQADEEDDDTEPKSAAAKAKAAAGSGAGASTEGTADGDGVTGPTSTGRGTSTSSRSR